MNRLETSTIVAPAASSSVVGGLFQVPSCEHAPGRTTWTHMQHEELKIGDRAAAAQLQVRTAHLMVC
jgi:hypothetical protein